MDRRRFLSAGGAALAALACPKPLRAGNCPTPTTSDLYGYGPYYLPNAPRRAMLAGADEPGTPLEIRGTVADCTGPIPGATLEVWHATDAGCYIHPSLPACEDHGNPEVSRLWGSLVSDANGEFSFRTIKPGRYLNGYNYRPSHIHFRIRRPATAGAAAVDLVTQLYFEGDDAIIDDPGANDPGAESRIIALTDQAGCLNGTFPVVLPGGPSGLRGSSDPFSDPALSMFDISVQRSGDVFRIFLPPVPAGTQVEARLYGADGRLFRRSLHSLRPIELDASLWPRGVYQTLLLWHTSRGQRSERVSLRR